MNDSDLQRLVDERDIVDLAVAYCWALDTQDWDGLDAIFLPDATAVLGGGSTLEGRERIKERVAMALGELDDSQHLVGSHQVVVDGDAATHRCYLHAQHVGDSQDMSRNFIVAGRYEDELVRTPDGWRIRHRTLAVMWTAGSIS